MIYGMYISAEGAQAQSTRLEALANNLANVDTPGFKCEFALMQSRYAEETAQGKDYPGSGSINDIGGGVEIQGLRTDFTGGPIQQTNLETDMAINGEGFFMVRHGEEDMLTRAGNFQLTATGALVTQQGDAVLDDRGTPIVIDPEAGPWSVGPSGTIAQAGDETNLALVRTESLGDLVKLGENLFRPLSTPTALDPTERRVLSGYIERSAVKATQEMSELITTSRAFEANVNMVRTQDGLLETLVSRLLRHT
jgi:flagellar basal-body rod protein FlgF